MVFPSKKLLSLFGYYVSFPLDTELLGKDILLWTSPDETKIAFTQISAPPKELRRKRSTDTPESESSQV